MPGIIVGTDKISEKYQKMVAQDYIKLQQKITAKIKSINAEPKATRRLISSIQGK